MAFRLLADAQAQTTVPGPITAAASSIVGQSTANFTQPQNFGNGQISLTVLDAGNPAWNPAAPLATPFEYIFCGNNNTGTNTFSTLTRGVANTTAHAFFAGAIIAQGLLAEDIVASAPWKFDEQLLSVSTSTVNIPPSGSIPASYLGINYRHIQIEWSCTTTTNGTPTTLTLRYNGDSGTNYVYNEIDATGGSVTGGGLASNTTSLRIGALPGTNTSGNEAGGTIDIYNFAAVSPGPRRIMRCTSWRDDSNGVGIEITAGIWLNTANPITAIALAAGAGSLGAQSLFTTRLLP